MASADSRRPTSLGGVASEDDAVPQLIREARAGSREALGELTEACRRYLLLLANRESPGELQAKIAPSDLVQESFLEAQRDFPGFLGATRPEFLAWLRRILRHNVADACRRFQFTDKRQAGRELPLHGGDPGNPEWADLPAGGRTPSRYVIAKDDRERLERALDDLPDKYRTVIALRHQQGLAFGDIATQMGRSVEAVRKLWFRALQQLRQLLENADVSR